MNRLVIAAAVALLLPSLALARDVAPGTVSVSGGAGASYSSTTSSASGFQDLETTTTDAQASARWFLTPTFAVGGTFQLQRTKQTSGGQSESSSTLFVGPALRVHVPFDPSAAVVFDAGVAIARASASNASADGWAWHLGAGVAWFPTDAVSLDAGLTFQSVRYDVDGLSTKNEGLGLGAGFTVYFGR